MTHHMQARARAVVHVRACIPSVVQPYHLEMQNVLIRTTKLVLLKTNVTKVNTMLQRNKLTQTVTNK